MSAPGGKTRSEQMSSAVHPTTDIAKILRHFHFVPQGDITIALFHLFGRLA
jgi:hypothetical protein